MKNILIFLFTCSPLFMISQSAGDYMLKFNLGMVSDENHAKHDIDNHSPDMYTGYSDDVSPKMGLQISAGYFLEENFLVGLNFMSAKIEGANAVETYNGEFTEFNVFTEYEFFEFSGLGFFAKGGFGRVSWDASRNLVQTLDGWSNEVPLNLDSSTPGGTPSDKSGKIHYGIGLNYNVTDFINVSCDITTNVVNHDGFDGWDYGSERPDRYTFASFAVGINIAELIGGSTPSMDIEEVAPVEEEVAPVEEEVAPVEEEVAPVEEEVAPVEEEVAPVEEEVAPEEQKDNTEEN